MFQNPNNPQLSSALNMVSKVAGWLWQRGWAEWGAGNISIDVSDIIPKLSATEFFSIETPVGFNDNEKNFLVSISGSRMRELMEQPAKGMCLVQLTENKNLRFFNLTVQNAPVVPTSEIAAHLAIQQMLQRCRPRHKAVLHTHPAEVIAFSQIASIHNEETLNQALTSILPEFSIYLPQGIGFVPSYPSGSLELANTTAQVLETKTVAIWQRHGIVATGATLEDSFDAIDHVCKAVKIYFLVSTSRPM